jgi:alpha-ketoglutarate-dependent taurine dioxygenase
MLKQPLPFIVELPAGADVADWLSSNRQPVERHLDEHGALLLRGGAVSNEADFEKFVRAYSPNMLDYVYRSTPRTEVAKGVYTATEYPPGKTIPLHNENAYQRSWPLRLHFCCLQPAEGGGGETPLADVTAVTERIDPSVRQKFLEKGVMYIRNYRKDIDLRWQTVFQTESKEEVEEYCSKQGIECEWKADDNLTTRQVCQAFATHPRTGAVVWFNQAHLFHTSSLDERTRAAMSKMFDERDFPRHSTFGDGTPIEAADLEHVRTAFEKSLVTFKWRARDVLVVDNMMVAHGRAPYRGKRRVLVAMTDLVSPAPEAPAGTASSAS